MSNKEAHSLNSISTGSLEKPNDILCVKGVNRPYGEVVLVLIVAFCDGGFDGAIKLGRTTAIASTENDKHD